MSLFGDRLVISREKAGLSQKSLAELLEITPTRLNYWEKGKREPDIKMIKKISETLNTSPDYLIGNDNFKRSTYDIEEVGLINSFRKLTPQGKQKVQTYMHDILGNPIYKLEKDNIYKFPIQCYDRAVSAGTGNPLDYESSSIVYISKKPPENTSFMLLVEGDSMTPTYNNGDYVFVDKDAEPYIGDIGIFIFNSIAYIKERGEKGLISHNPTYELIKGSEDIRLVGKVIGKYTGEVASCPSEC